MDTYVLFFQHASLFSCHLNAALSGPICHIEVSPLSGGDAHAPFISWFFLWCLLARNLQRAQAFIAFFLTEKGVRRQREHLDICKVRLLNR
jgi:hypothetical protein